MADQHSTQVKRNRNPPCTCQHCGNKYINKRRGNEGKQYCSRDCAYASRKAASVAPQSIVYWPCCDVCGTTFLSRRSNSRICSTECGKVEARMKAVLYNQRTYQRDRTPRSCKCCGNVFTPDYGDMRRTYCSAICLARDTTRHTRKAKKRAEHYGVEYEYVNPIKVFERDGWRCQICGKPTPRNKRGKLVSNAPELDHRIPISKGGSHMYINTQCACRQCNEAKGNRSETGQLPMFQHAA